LLIVAPFVGSLLGVLIRRLPVGAPVVWARSCCVGCGGALAPAELVPLLSYAWLRGACRRCGAAIGRFHPAVELAALGVAGVALAVDPAGAWLACLLGWPLLALAWIDVETMTLPDALTLPLLLAGLAASAWFAPDALGDHALGAALGWGGLALVGWAYRRARGVEGLGAGDCRLLAAGGAWLGWAALPDVVVLASVAGIAAALARRLPPGARQPFGPALAAAIWAMFLARAAPL
jgi:leader peptidase (prepilin peptidase) / N-methyltransferase